MRTPPVTVLFSRAALLAQRDAHRFLRADGSVDVEQLRKLPAPRVHARHRRTGEIHEFAIPTLILAGTAAGAAADVIVTPGNPSDYGPAASLVDLSASPLHVDDDVSDVAQGQNPDCYLHATGAGIGHQQPKALRSLITQGGPNLYEVRFVRGGKVTRVRTDGRANLTYAHPGPSKAIWPIILEKAYAYYRTGANTMESLAYGFPGTVLADLGYKTVINVTPSAVTILTLLMAWLSAGCPCLGTTYGSIPAGIPIVAAHCYEIHGITADGKIVLFNPYGFDAGGNQDDNVWDGYVTLSVAQFNASFSAVSVGTEAGFPILDSSPVAPPTSSTTIPAPATPAVAAPGTYDRARILAAGWFSAGQGGYPNTLGMAPTSTITIPIAGVVNVSVSIQQASGVVTLNSQAATAIKGIATFQGVTGPLIFTGKTGWYDVMSITITAADAPAPVVYTVSVAAPGAAPQTFTATKIAAVLADGTPLNIPEAA
jgi:hypothetical protein